MFVKCNKGKILKKKGFALLLGCRWLCHSLRLDLPEYAMGWLPLRLGIGSSR